MDRTTVGVFFTFLAILAIGGFVYNKYQPNINTTPIEITHPNEEINDPETIEYNKVVVRYNIVTREILNRLNAGESPTSQAIQQLRAEQKKLDEILLTWRALWK